MKIVPSFWNDISTQVIDAAYDIFIEMGCEEDCCIQSVSSSSVVFGSHNRLIWTAEGGFKPDPPYCTEKFLDSFKARVKREERKSILIDIVLHEGKVSVECTNAYDDCDIHFPLPENVSVSLTVYDGKFKRSPVKFDDKGKPQRSDYLVSAGWLSDDPAIPRGGPAVWAWHGRLGHVCSY